LVVSEGDRVGRAASLPRLILNMRRTSDLKIRKLYMTVPLLDRVIVKSDSTKLIRKGHGAATAREGFFCKEKDACGYQPVSAYQGAELLASAVRRGYTPRETSSRESSMSEVTRILSAMEQGDEHAAARLLPLVYDELRRLAAHKLLQEKPGQTLDATALVHEAYVRLVESDKEQNWDSRGHFFAAAAEAMRRILVDNARRKKTEKHGGELRRVELAEAAPPAVKRLDDLLLLDDALSLLAQEDPSAAEVAKLRLFTGLSVEDASAALGLSRATAFRHWTYARAWLQARLSDGPG
jgi:RNA polymerase sigma factor (TIGR02999 family)